MFSMQYFWLVGLGHASIYTVAFVDHILESR